MAPFAVPLLFLSLPLLGLGARSSHWKTNQALEVDKKKKTAAKQMEEIWGHVLADEEEPAPMPSAFAPLKLMAAAKELPLIGRFIEWANFTEDLSTTFTWRKDYPLPPGHEKLIHPVGSVAKVSLEWDQEAVKSMSLTGVFTWDQQYALMRVGPAGKVQEKGMAPGVSLKVFRDYKESVNTLMLYSLRGQDGFNHFEHTLCNKLSDFRDKSFAESLLLKSFKTASEYPFTTGLAEWGEYKRQEPQFPFALCLRPMDDVRVDYDFWNFPPWAPFGHIQDQLQELKESKVIYEIYASSSPKAQMKKIGKVRLASEFHKTKWGDQKLFFRHAKFEDDLKLKPEWKEFVDDEEFWYEEGAANEYSYIDPSSKKETGNANAWGGGYNPSSGKEISDEAWEHFKSQFPFADEKFPWERRKSESESSESSEPSFLQTGRSSGGCPFAYLHQGEDSWIHRILK